MCAFFDVCHQLKMYGHIAAALEVDGAADKGAAAKVEDVATLGASFMTSVFCAKCSRRS